MQISGEVALPLAFYLNLERAAKVKRMDLQPVPHRRSLLIGRSRVVEFAKSLLALAGLTCIMQRHRVRSSVVPTSCQGGAHGLATRKGTHRGLAGFAKSLPALAKLTCMRYRLHA